MNTNRAVSMISLVLTIVIIIILAAITAPLLSDVLGDSTRLDAEEEFANISLVVKNAKREILAERYVPNEEFVINDSELENKFGGILSQSEIKKIEEDNNPDSSLKAPFKYYLFNQERFNKEFGNDFNVKRIRGDREYLINFMDELIITNFDGKKMIEGNIEAIDQAVRGEVNVVFTPKGNYGWKKQQTANVELVFTKSTTIKDAKCLWSESSSHPSDTEFNTMGVILNTSGAVDSDGTTERASTENIELSGKTGNGWFLWVRVEYVDDGETRIKYEKSEPFFIDNTNPTFDLEVS